MCYREIQERLVSEGICEEQEALAIAQEVFESEASSQVNVLAEYLEDRGLSLTDCQRILGGETPNEDKPQGNASSHEESSEADSDDGTFDEAGDAEGQPDECELCERYMMLTKHHLIPKSTWNKMKPLLLRSLEDLQHEQAEGRRAYSSILLDESWKPLLENWKQEVSATGVVKFFHLNVAYVCRPCHSTIHRVHTNMELAERFHTVDLLVQDEAIEKFCRWASKQKTGKYRTAR